MTDSSGTTVNVSTKVVGNDHKTYGTDPSPPYTAKGWNYYDRDLSNSAQAPGPIRITVGANGSVSGGTTLNGTEDNQLVLNSTTASVTGDVTMYDAPTTDANFLTITNGLLSAEIKVGQGVIRISDATNNGDSKIQGTISTNSGNAYWRLSGATFTTNKGIVNAGADYDEIEVNNTTSFDASTKILSSGGETFLYMHDATANAKGVVGGFAGSIDMDAKKDTLYIGKDANFMDGATATVKSSVANTENTVVINTANGVNSGTYKVEGTIDFSAATATDATNIVHIASGYVHAEDAMGDTVASIKGAGAGGTVTYYISGGQTSSIDTNAGTGLYHFQNGTINIKGPLDLVGSPPAQVPLNSQVYNVQNVTGGVNKTSLEDQSSPGDFNKTKVSFDGGDYLVYSLLNIGYVDPLGNPSGTDNAVTITGGATLTIGAINYKDNDMTAGTRYDFKAISLDSTANGYDYSQHYAGNEAQITASSVGVYAGSKLVIHDSGGPTGNFGKNLAGMAADSHNIINELNIFGTVTLDRTSIHGVTDTGMLTDTAQVNVKAGGELRGFGHYTSATDHTPVRGSVYGNVTLEAGAVDAAGLITQRGGTIRPYDETLFDLGHNDPAATIPANNGEKDTDAVRKLMGVVMRITKDGTATSGNLEFKNTSFLSTRLFHQNDVYFDNPANQITIDGGTHKLYYSDSVHADTLVFKDIWSNTATKDNVLNTTPESRYAQAKKAQYDPVFGFNYELKSKLDFQLYKGDPNDDTQTYYYRVAMSDNVIKELYQNWDTTDPDKLMDDANHLFNRLILKSDMLGEWEFMYTPDKKSIVLRYRLLADHPHNGGFVVAETERNNILPGKYLDEIRYPFWTDSSKLNLPKDYAGDLNLLKDPSFPHTGDDLADLEYNHDGYNGNMVDFYAKNAGQPGYEAIDNYRPEWIQDWEDLLMGFQLDIISGRDMRRGLRMLHAESYANLSESNFNVMSQFIRNRERNAVSALYQVESKEHRDMDYEDVGDVIDAGENERHINMFVENPIRFWASGFGSEGRQKNSGNEYGYDTEIWGGALGVIKEHRDVYFGATIGYARAKNDWDDLPSNGTTNSYLAEALFGARLFDWGFVELHGNYSYGEQEMNRVINLGGGYYNGWARGEFKDHLFGGGIRVGYQKLMGGWAFMPTLGIQAMHYRSGAFTEHGRDNMSNLMKFEDGAMNRTVVKTPLLLRLSRSFTVGGNVLTPEIRTGITPLLGSTRGKARAEWVGNPFLGRKFTSYGADRGNYEVEAGATIELSRRGRFYMAGNYDYVYSKKSHMHNYSLQAGWNF